MKPTGLEAMNALRAGLAEVLGPELRSDFAIDTAQTLQMLIESLSGEWDTAAENLCHDNETLTRLLVELKSALSGDGNDGADSTVNLIDETLADSVADSLVLSVLSARNKELRGALERAIVLVEDRADDESLWAVRKAVYEHLREVAGRGWSFWDMASFREYMARYRSGA